MNRHTNRRGGHVPLVPIEPGKSSRGLGDVIKEGPQSTHAQCKSGCCVACCIAAYCCCMPCMACAIAACAVLLAAACVAALLLALSMIACRPWRKFAPVRGSADCAGCCGGACCAPWAELCAAASAAFAWPLLGEPSGGAGTASTLSDVSRACPA